MPDNPPATSSPRAVRVLYGVALAAFALPLLLYVITGATARFVQDDYCYAVHLRANGWPNAALQAYLHVAGFSGNRFALTFFLDLAELAGPLNVPALPGLMIVLWLSAAYWLARGLNRAFSWGISRLLSLLLSAALVCLTLYLAPNRVQILYWRPGLFTYLAPLVLFFWLAAWVVSRLGRPTRAWTLAGIAALALVVGSFSETAAVFEGGVFGLGLLAAWIGLRAVRPAARGAFRLTWAGLLGSLLAMAGLILSPAARLRQAAMFPEPPPPLEILQISLESARFFVVHTLYRVTLPTLAIGGLAVCLGFLLALQRHNPAGRPLHRLILRLVIATPAAFFLLLCVTAPSAYAEATYPEARVLLFARLVVVVFTGAAGWWCGEALAGLLPSPRAAQVFAWLVSPFAALYAAGLFLVRPGALLEPAYPDLRAYVFAHPVAELGALAAGLLLAAGLGWLTRRGPLALAPLVLAGIFLLQPLHAARSAVLEYPDYLLRGQMWDLRDAQIRREQAAGAREITVRALDSWAGITELQANPDHWVNNCAADYYHVDSITAVEPILNPPQYTGP